MGFCGLKQRLVILKQISICKVEELLRAGSKDLNFLDSFSLPTAITIWGVCVIKKSQRNTN